MKILRISGEGGRHTGLAGAGGWGLGLGLWASQFPALNGLLDVKALAEIYIIRSFAPLWNPKFEKRGEKRTLLAQNNLENMKRGSTGATTRYLVRQRGEWLWRKRRERKGSRATPWASVAVVQFPLRSTQGKGPNRPKGLANGEQSP